jgi:hypothetical protein
MNSRRDAARSGVVVMNASPSSAYANPGTHRSSSARKGASQSS